MDLGIHCIDRDNKFLVDWRGQDSGPTHLPDIVALAQKFAKILLTSTGSDIYALPFHGEEIGCGLKKYLAQEMDSDTTLVAARSRIRQFIAQTERFILQEQARFPGMGASMRLQSAVLNNVTFGADGRVIIDLTLTNAAGDKFQTAIDDRQVLNFRRGDR